MRQLQHLFASLTSEVVPGPTKQQGRHTCSAFRMEIRNTMRVPLFWRNALGMVVHEPPSASTTAGEYFYIMIEYEFDPGVKIDARELLNELDLPENHTERKQIYEALQSLEREPQWHHQRKFTYTLGIDRERLEAAGGVAYLNDVDLVVGFAKHASDATHPYSPPGQRERMSNAVDPAEGFQQRMVLVDNAGVNGPRWINTGFGVYEVTPVEDPSLQDGFYLTVFHHRSGEPSTEHHTYVVAEKTFGLYRSRAEAEAFGSPEERFKAELKETEQQIARDKVALAREKQQVDRERHEMEREKRTEEDRREREKTEHEAQLARERDQLDRERERMKFEKERMEYERQTFSERQKFEYDMRSRDRKDHSEQTKALLDMAKIMLGLVTTGLSLYAVIKKNSN